MENNNNIITVSAAWATKEVACTFEYIQSNCKGCCTGKNFWNPVQDGTSCDHLKENGCEFEAETRPINCLLYPFIINKKNRLVFHGRALIHYCGPNYGVGGMTIWEQQKTNLTALFGKEQYERVQADISEGKDSWVEATPDFFVQLENENKLFREIVETQIKQAPPARLIGNWKDK